LPLARSGKSALEVAVEAAREAGKILLDYFHSQKTITRKGEINLVTDVDYRSEKVILELLGREYPDFNIVSEESNSSATVSGYTWIVDPLDGTNNYIFGIPMFCTNIALVENDRIVLGVTYDPLRDELFRVQSGRGVYLNGLAVRVSGESSLKASLLAFDLGYSVEEGQRLLSMAGKLRNHVHCIRIIGSAALGLAYVACGRVTVYMHRSIYPWDIAGGLLMVREAGGEVIDWHNKPATVHSGEVIASNAGLRHEFLQYLD